VKTAGGFFVAYQKGAATTMTMNATKPKKKFEIAFGVIPDSWACVDCGINTAPGIKNRQQTEQLFNTPLRREPDGVVMAYNRMTEVYWVKPEIWKLSGMEPYGGCICIGCLEKRIGRTLTPKDFPTHVSNGFPCTERLESRRGPRIRSEMVPPHLMGKLIKD
jgi:hypothetical protein